MCCASCADVSFADLLRDPLIQLVMQSDGVTEGDIIALREQVIGTRAGLDLTRHRSAGLSARLRVSPRALLIEKLQTELQHHGVFLRVPADALAGS
jgi:hypothetical protein